MRGTRSILYANAFRGIRSAVRQSGWVQRGVAGAFILLSVAIAVGAFLFFQRSFLQLLDDRVAGPLIIKYLVDSAFLLVFFLGVVSFVATSVRALFRSDEVARLTPLPIEPIDLFAYRFTLAAAFAAWPVMLLAFPALVALGTVTGAGVSYYLACLLILALFSALIALCGAVLAFLAGMASRSIPPFIVLFAELAGSVGIAVGLARLIIKPFASDTFFDVPDLAAAAVRVDALRALFGPLPSHPFVELLSTVLPGAASKATVLEAAALLAVLFTLAAFALSALVRFRYAGLLQEYRETGFTARPEDVERRARRRRFPAFMKWGHSFLFEKELLVLLRNPAELSRAGIMVLLMVVYVFAVRGVAAIERFSDPATQALLVSCAFFALGYFASTLGMRFVYPSLSLEGRAAWVLWISPVHNHEFYSWKLFFWSSLSMALALATSILTVVVFGLPLSLATFFVFALCCASVTIVAVTLGQGSMYPRFDESDPDALSTTPAGLTATIICLGYVWILARYMHAYALAYITKNAFSVMPFFGVLIVTIAIVGAYAFIAPRAMDELEFPR
jgi:ABC-2 type transport system permease protein